MTGEGRQCIGPVEGFFLPDNEKTAELVLSGLLVRSIVKFKFLVVLSPYNFNQAMMPTLRSTRMH